ncbi:peptidylprolyl isomerase [Hephaestia sp. GCM10023244]|uniref:peptidylprolyl isomerase n=1 Tax=unclassified Hephaestia TaxID=2631281 RepID=UPI002076F68D|nr:peptidylprolyl isomerase [Hephaestia sp. MAHUQ-44]MCM8731378.1 peptidylprolyl isomerase [Hephaestia sp. MAHUQ-44]
MISWTKAAGFGRWLGVAAGLALATALVAQTADQQPNDAPNSAANLNIPADAQILGKADPNVRKPTAIVNDAVLTGTDVDQRVALIKAANNIPDLPPADLERLRLQILAQLIDETLEIQEAKANKITVTPAEVNQGFARVSRNFEKTPDEMRAYLRSIGSSDRSLRLQIEAELAWQRYLGQQVEPFVNVGEEEVQGILDRLKAQEGQPEYHLKEIFLGATPDRLDQVAHNAQGLMDEIKKGQHPFEYFAQYSEASTKAVGGDLGWIQANTLPAPLAEAAQQMQVGQVAGPIPNSGGFSILYLVDERKVLTADPRDARLSLRQLTIEFAPGTTQDQASARASKFAQATQAIKGCGDATAVAREIGATLVDNDQVRVRDLPPQLQQLVLNMSIGEATPPFGSPSEGVRALVLCGRDTPQSGQLPDPSQVQSQIEQQRVNLRAQQMLRDLRRDAIVEYR